MADQGKQVLLASPRGYCAGVDRAVETVEKALEKYGAPVYVRKEIVHNKYVVETLEQRGVIFVDETDEVPEGAHLVFSAHGVSPAVREGHEEVEGTAGEAPEVTHLVDGVEGVAGLPDFPADQKLVWLSQTTLSVDETMEIVNKLHERYPNLENPPSDDICYATQNRQAAVKQIAPRCELVIVVGSQNSSNSKRLVEVALDAGANAAYLVDYATQIDDAWLDGVDTIGISSGASVPDILVREVLDYLAVRGYGDVEEVTTTVETITFALPRDLRKPRLEDEEN